MRSVATTSVYFQGIVKILKGVLQYRALYRKGMVKQFEAIRDDPHPDAVFFSCMDSRMLPTRFTQTNVGDMFIVRNAGNLIPNAGLYDFTNATTEPAALELGCVINNIKDIVICGHSDCKAMNLLYELRDPEESSVTNRRLSPLKAWLCRHAAKSLEKFEQLAKEGFQKPIEFRAEQPMRRFVAYIDPDNRFSVTDKLSQINTLQQVENAASYWFLKDGLEEGSIHVHALWFDIYTGNIFYFSRHQKCFVEIREDTVDKLIREVTS